jgi:MFS family permease
LALKPFRSLKVRNYRLYFIGQVISVSGTWMQNFALGWLVLQTYKNNSLYLGIITACQFLPMLIFGSWGGLIADRYKKRSLLFFTQTSFLILAVLLGVLTVLKEDKLGYLIVVAFLIGIFNLFDVPARQSFVQEMVGRTLITNAVSLNSLIMNAARIVGPGIGGVIVDAIGVAPCFFINAASFLAVIIALLMMKVTELYSTKPVKPEKGQIRAGFKYVLNKKELLIPLLVMAVVGTLAYNFQVTLLLMAKMVFKSHAQQAGLLFGAMGIGAVLGALLVANLKAPTAKMLMFTCGAFGALLLGVSLSPNFLIGAILLIPTGAFSIAFIAVANSSLQLQSDPQMRGRVMALYAIAFLGSTPVGSLIVSAVAYWQGARYSLGLGAVSALLSAMVAFVILRRRSKAVVTQNVDIELNELGELNY